MLFGDPGKFTGAIVQTQSEALSRGIRPEILSGLFDPNASNIVKMNSLLLYKAAAALAGQSGREVSDKDIVHLKNIVGDPASWLEGSQQYLNGIQFVRDIAAQGMQSAEQSLSAGDVRAGGATAPAPAVPAATPQAAPAATGAMTEGRTATGPDGRKYIVRGGQLVPMQ
jgi:hypothetical protein